MDDKELKVCEAALSDKGAVISFNKKPDNEVLSALKRCSFSFKVIGPRKGWILRGANAERRCLENISFLYSRGWVVKTNPEDLLEKSKYIRCNFRIDDSSVGFNGRNFFLPRRNTDHDGFWNEGGFISKDGKWYSVPAFKWDLVADFVEREGEKLSPEAEQEIVARAAQNATNLPLGERCGRRVTMTGTIASQGIEDLYSQYYFLSPHILNYRSWFSFKPPCAWSSGGVGKRATEKGSRYPEKCEQDIREVALLMKNLPEVIKILKDGEKEGLSATELCARAGIDVDFYLRWSSGKSMADVYAWRDFSSAQDPKAVC